jgi:hypothetical protein
MGWLQGPRNGGGRRKEKRASCSEETLPIVGGLRRGERLLGDGVGGKMLGMVNIGEGGGVGMPQSGSETKFERELFRTGLKFSSRFDGRRKNGSEGKEIFRRPLRHLKTLLAPPSSRAPLEHRLPSAVKPRFSPPLFAVFGLALQL